MKTLTTSQAKAVHAHVTMHADEIRRADKDNMTTLAGKAFNVMFNYRPDDAYLFTAHLYPPATKIIPADSAPALTHCLAIADIDYVSRAMAIKDVRYYLCGIAVYSDGSIAATDGHRLHGNSLLHLKSHALEPIAVIPAKIIQLIKKLQKKGSLKLEILLGEYSPEKLIRQKYIRIELDNAKIECLAADGRYPEISQVIPKGTKELPQFTGNIICTDLKRATDIAKSASKYCVAKLVNGTAYTMRIDEKLELPINIDAPTALEIGTNTRYITDALFKNVSAEFKYTNSLNPMLIINTGTYAVVMPARL